MTDTRAAKPVDPIVTAEHKGYPLSAPDLPLSQIGQQGWTLWSGHLSLPVAVLRAKALARNIDWMQDFVSQRGLSLAPHGKTTMSPQLFRRQVKAGAWGITFANVRQALVGLRNGVECVLIANQVVTQGDLQALWQAQRAHPSARIVFLLDSMAQLTSLERFDTDRETNASPSPWQVLLEVGLPGGRTGCRNADQALALARAARRSHAVRLVGLSCYEGLGATGDDAVDEAHCAEWSTLLTETADRLRQENLLEPQPGEPLLISAGGSAIFDLIAPALTLDLGHPTLGLLRSGCYVTHDEGHYQRLVQRVNHRLGCHESLRNALELWTVVQSCPEPGLVILALGKRDAGHDMGLPRPLAWARSRDDGSIARLELPAGAEIVKMNDQHAYLHWPEVADAPAPCVGDWLGLGVSHPCTTFDRWSWMPVLDDEDRVVDAISTHFG
jgi:D-serine dehydratase